jgi:hypothetical protein
MNVHRHPRSILEVRRILREHRVAALAEVHSQQNTRQVSFQNVAAPGQEGWSAAHDRALAVAREYLGQPVDADYHVLPHAEGLAVLVRMADRQRGALPQQETPSECLVVVSPDGRVVRVVPET